MNTPNLHAFTITFLGATYHKSSRLKIKSERFNQSVIIPYDHAFNNTLDIAKDYLTKNGYELAGQAETNDNYIILSTTFEPLKK